MKKIILTLLSLHFIAPAFAAKEAVYIQELPQEVSAHLDLLTSGALSKIVLNRLCERKSESESYKEVGTKMNEILEEKVPQYYKKVAIKYVEDAIQTKTRAFKQVYADKGCHDLENLKGIAWHAGFKN